MKELDTQSNSQKLDRVLYILENDNKTNRKGLVEEVSEIKKDLDQLITKDKILSGKIAVVGFIGGFGFTLISWIFNNFYNKR